MATPKQLKDLALIRLDEAEALFAAGLYDGAKYLAGYVVELALKTPVLTHPPQHERGTHMVENGLVGDFRKLADDIASKEGPLSLFMVVAFDADTYNGLNVIVSAPGFDAKSIGTAVREVSDALRRNVRQSEWHRFLRVTPLRTDDPFVRAMNSRFHAEQSVINLDSLSVTGIDIPHAVLLESKRVAA